MFDRRIAGTLSTGKVETKKISSRRISLETTSNSRAEMGSTLLAKALLHDLPFPACFRCILSFVKLALSLAPRGFGVEYGYTRERGDRRCLASFCFLGSCLLLALRPGDWVFVCGSVGSGEFRC
jgi:hypothetical protein